MDKERVSQKWCEVLGRNALIGHFILSWEGNKVESKLENAFF